MKTQSHPDPVALPPAPEARYSSADVARLAGLTYRRVDYYTRQGILEPAAPAAGCGSRRSFGPEQVPRARLAAMLMDLGADVGIVRTAVRELPADTADWPTYFFVTRAGRVKHGLPLPAACWWISTPALLAAPPPAAESDAA